MLALAMNFILFLLACTNTSPSSPQRYKINASKLVVLVSAFEL